MVFQDISTNYDCPSCHCHVSDPEVNYENAVLGKGNCSNPAMLCTQFNNPRLNGGEGATTQTCQCVVWPSGGPNCDVLEPQYYYMVGIWTILLFVTSVFLYRNCRMTYFLLKRHKFILKPANISSGFISAAMFSECIRYIYWWLRCAG